MLLFKHLKALFVLQVLGTIPACASTQRDQPARIKFADQAVAAKVTETLKTVLGRQNISVIASDPVNATVLSVPPAPLGPYETRSMATPETFDVFARGRACVLVRRTTQTAHLVAGVTCEASASSTKNN